MSWKSPPPISCRLDDWAGKVTGRLSDLVGAPDARRSAPLEATRRVPGRHKVPCHHTKISTNRPPCGYLSLAGDGTILKVNETLLTWLDYERSEIVGALRFPELLSMGGRIYYETHFAPLLNMQGFVNEVAFDLQTKQGRQIPVMTSTIQRRDPRNTATVNRMTVFNMTERRRYERELLIERQKAERIAEDHAALAKELQTDIAARQRAEVLLREQAHLNAFAAQIALHLIERGALADMLDGCVRTIVDELKAAHACIWSLRADDQTLEVQASAGTYRDLRPIHSRIPRPDALHVPAELDSNGSFNARAWRRLCHGRSLHTDLMADSMTDRRTLPGRRKRGIKPESFAS